MGSASPAQKSPLSAARKRDGSAGASSARAGEVSGGTCCSWRRHARWQCFAQQAAWETASSMRGCRALLPIVYEGVFPVQQ